MTRLDAAVAFAAARAKSTTAAGSRQVMGACLGCCFTSISDRFTNRSYHRHQNLSNNGEEQIEADQSASPVDEQQTDNNSIDQPKPKRLLSFFSLKKFKQHHRVPVTLELIEDTGWPRRSNRYTKLNSKHISTSSGLDNPLQMLDAKELLTHQGCVSSAASSVDLEWEHEGIQLAASAAEEEKLVDADNESLSEPSVHNSQPSSLTASPWSRVSTPNSLEWDPVEADIVDVETENLLTEIERLTDRTLKETGDWTTNSS